jgi:hypothetical protein
MNPTIFKRAGFSIVLAAALSNAAMAQTTRTWVSGVGDDANPCSRTAPCKSFSGTFSKTAAGGEISILDVGDFGAVNITKSMTLYAEGALASMAPTGNGINITGSGLSVTLRGLILNGSLSSANGVNVTGSGDTVHIENTQVYGFPGNGINVAPSGGTTTVTVTNSRISDCSGLSSSGINADATNGLATTVSLVNTEVHNCPTGLNAIMGAKVNARYADFSQNITGAAVAGANTVSGAVSEAFLDSGTISFCTTAVSAAAGGTARLSNMTIADNATGLANITAGLVVSFGNNRIKGNTTNGAPTSTVFVN